MSYVFISGIPTAGKSYLAKKLSEDLGIRWEKLDDYKEVMKKDPKLEYWVNYYFNKDPAQYFESTNCNERWADLVSQSEAFWPCIKSHIESVVKEYPSVIFESVNLLPHLAKKLPFGGIYLLGQSLEETVERNKIDPRWSKDEKVQELEARNFFNCERPYYESESVKYGFKSFSDPYEAEIELLKILDKK